jgi:hypothetical protein
MEPVPRFAPHEVSFSTAPFPPASRRRLCDQVTYVVSTGATVCSFELDTERTPHKLSGHRAPRDPSAPRSPWGSASPWPSPAIRAHATPGRFEDVRKNYVVFPFEEGLNRWLQPAGGHRSRDLT